MFLNKLRAFAKNLKRARRQQRSKKGSCRPEVEALEDRQLLSAMIPALDSKPGAAHTLFLDFDGFSGYGGSFFPVVRPAFDTDGHPDTFSDAEAATIQSAWTYVAEDYAPFNINVTTVEPAAGKFLRVVIGGTDPTGDHRSGRTPYDFTDDYADEDHPLCYVFPAEIGNSARMIGGTASHESGHVLGLEHQSDWRGRDHMVREYGEGDANRTPIMGDNLASDRVMWWRGRNDDGDTQDDISILRSALGYRADEPNNDFASARSLTSMTSWTREGVFQVIGPTVPTLGRYDRFLVGSGIIGNTGDADYFTFDHATGPLLVQANTLGNVANLDAKLELYRLMGTRWEPVDTQDPALTGAFTGLDAEIRSDSLPGGRYVAVVRSHGGYGDVGHYTITAKDMLPPDAPRIYSSVGPRFLYGPGGTYSFGIRVSFSEAVDASSFDALDVFFTNPSGEEIRPLRIDAFPGAVNFDIVLPELTVEARYRLQVGPGIYDLTGDYMNQDGDYAFGESLDDRYVRNFDYHFPPPPPPTPAELAAAFPGGVPAHFADLVEAFWDLRNLQNLYRGGPQSSPTRPGPITDRLTVDSLKPGSAPQTGLQALSTPPLDPAMVDLALKMVLLQDPRV